MAEVAGRAIERIDLIIDDLEKLGKNTTEMRSLLSDAESSLEKANSALNSGDIETAKNNLKNVRDDFKDILKAYVSLENLSAKDMALIRNTSHAVEAVVQDIDSSVA